jgi:hypothetical protein
LNTRDRAGFRGVGAPLLAVAALLLLLVLLDLLAGIDGLVVPKPVFRNFVVPGYPDKVPLDVAATIVEAAMWWLCLSFLLWTAGLLAIGLCWLQLHRATRHDAALRRKVHVTLVLTILLVLAVLAYVAVVRRTPLMPFGPLVENLALMSGGFIRLATFNTALVFVVGTVLLLGASLLLMPGVHADVPMQQMQAITRLMYGAAVFLLVWMSAATAMYRLCAVLLVAEAREPALKLAPTISLMGGLFLSLLLAAAYASASAWLQHCHERLHLVGAGQPPAAQAAGPQALLVAHWPKVIAILMPLLPGAIESVLQAVGHAP